MVRLDTLLRDCTWESILSKATAACALPFARSTSSNLSVATVLTFIGLAVFLSPGALPDPEVYGMLALVSVPNLVPDAELEEELDSGT